jgi:hypothetical protein
VLIGVRKRRSHRTVLLRLEEGRILYRYCKSKPVFYRFAIEQISGYRFFPRTIAISCDDLQSAIPGVRWYETAGNAVKKRLFSAGQCTTVDPVVAGSSPVRVASRYRYAQTVLPRDRNPRKALQYPRTPN